VCYRRPGPFGAPVTIRGRLRTAALAMSSDALFTERNDKPRIGRLGIKFYVIIILKIRYCLK